MKATKKVTYRKSWGSGYGQVPCLILEGEWLTEKYGLVVGDNVGIEYGKKNIVINMKGVKK